MLSVAFCEHRLVVCWQVQDGWIRYFDDAFMGKYDIS